MRPWVELARADAPGGDTLRLMRREAEFSIRLAGGNELMNSRLGGSEEALARLAVDACGAPAPRVLIGGLGMGFTLRETLARTGPAARVTVAEIVPALADWARGPMAPVFGTCLDDPRVTLDLRDVARPIAEGGWDAILLDVDNGPDGLTRPGNDALYSEAGLRAAAAALAPGGVLAVWSAHPAPAFTRRLAATGFRVTTETVRATRARRGPRHTIWIAQT
ncbi:polyamine aminopropyltransferase [Jannaschia ovalis]|uniref:Spermidine synthase n=1 Tax=Jannaschia ovalis TaxID=3038773 RepID=A0ABY8LHG4_9RHOB|nr:spermidine synthase [Jannaschia sp. GRR-S6-38]WGH80102.1 spermidine synthase [Jannaschia sp. GRR-S6-38]